MAVAGNLLKIPQGSSPLVRFVILVPLRVSAKVQHLEGLETCCHPLLLFQKISIKGSCKGSKTLLLPFR